VRDCTRVVQRLCTYHVSSFYYTLFKEQLVVNKIIREVVVFSRPEWSLVVSHTRNELFKSYPKSQPNIGYPSKSKGVSFQWEIAFEFK